jgi:hypothetical protein
MSMVLLDHALHYVIVTSDFVLYVTPIDPNPILYSCLILSISRLLPAIDYFHCSIHFCHLRDPIHLDLISCSCLITSNDKVMSKFVIFTIPSILT